MGLITLNRPANFSKNYNYKEFPFKIPPEISEGSHEIYPVVIVGAGPIGLSLAIDLAQRGVKSVLLDDNNICLLYTSPSPRDAHESRMPSSA